MKTRVLCVDDDQDQCDLLQAVLSRLGFSPTTTTSPGEALKLAMREPFEVIVTDLGMEEMAGLMLCSRMIGARPCIPIIVLTGQRNIDIVIGALRAGAYDFLTKPCAPTVLGASVARAILHHQLIARLAARSVRGRREIQDSRSLTYGYSPAPESLSVAGT